MKTLEKIASMNANNIEKKQMDELFGGVASQTASQPCTLETITCTPNGNKNDGDDSWEGECGVSVATAGTEAYK